MDNNLLGVLLGITRNIIGMACICGASVGVVSCLHGKESLVFVLLLLHLGIVVITYIHVHTPY